MEAKLTEIQDALDGISRRAANIRAGHVYVTSNVGAFGPAEPEASNTARAEPPAAKLAIHRPQTS